MLDELDRASLSRMTDNDRKHLDTMARVAALNAIVRVLATVIEHDKPGFKNTLRGTLLNVEDAMFSSEKIEDAEWSAYLRHKTLAEIEDLLS